MSTIDLQNKDTFMGAMIWFTGVIEDIDDPEELGRVKVRCYGYHSAKTEDIPTEELPWAICIAPITSASMSGIGEGTTGILQGSWVIGFWRDGHAAQDPVVLGAIPSISHQQSLTYGDGFKDPDREQPRENGLPDIPAMATKEFEDTDFFTKKKELRQEEIETASAPEMSMGGSAGDTERNTWNCNDPEEDIAPTYPFNHVKEYKSGHLVEFDDTEDKERISTMHMSGTYEEINAKGDKTVMVIGDNYEVYFKNKNIYIKKDEEEEEEGESGNFNLTIDGDFKTLVKGNYHLEVEKNFTINVKEQIHQKSGENFFVDVGQEMFHNVEEERTLQVGKDELREIEQNSKTITKGDNQLIIRGNQFTKTKGKSSYLTKGNATHTSTAGTMSLISKGNMKIQSKGNINKRATGNIQLRGTAIYLN